MNDEKTNQRSVTFFIDEAEAVEWCEAVGANTPSMAARSLARIGLRALKIAGVAPGATDAADDAEAAKPNEE